MNDLSPMGRPSKETVNLLGPPPALTVSGEQLPQFPVNHVMGNDKRHLGSLSSSNGGFCSSASNSSSGFVGVGFRDCGSGSSNNRGGVKLIMKESPTTHCDINGRKKMKKNRGLTHSMGSSSSSAYSGLEPPPAPPPSVFD